MSPDPLTYMQLEEPLTASDCLAREWANSGCTDCGWYHGFWQHMRLMGMGKTLSGLPHRFMASIASWRGIPNLKVLVSGAADYSALAHVITALGGPEGIAASGAKLTVVDRCTTPLALSEWYARRLAVPIRCYASDILAFESSERFDLIVTSSFLGYFDTAARHRLFAAYARLLTRRGRLVFANRLRPGRFDTAIGFSPEQIRHFVSHAISANAALAPEQQWQPEYVETAALAYANNFQSYPVTSVDDLTIFTDAVGLSIFQVHHEEPVLPVSARQAGLGGPTTASQSTYLFVEIGLTATN